MSYECKPILGYEGLYEVDNQGNIYSLSYNQTKMRKLMKPKLCKSGYLTIRLTKSGVPKTFLVHRIVLEAFVGNVSGEMEVCHNNGVRLDNKLENLRWDTRSANSLDRHKHGTHNTQIGSRNSQAKLTEESVRKIRDLSAKGKTRSDLASMFGVTRSLINRVVNRKIWTHVT